MSDPTPFFEMLIEPEPCRRCDTCGRDMAGAPGVTCPECRVSCSECGRDVTGLDACPDCGTPTFLGGRHGEHSAQNRQAPVKTHEPNHAKD